MNCHKCVWLGGHGCMAARCVRIPDPSEPPERYSPVAPITPPDPDKANAATRD